MKIAILLGSPAIGGGTYVIFEHASRLHQAYGEDVTIVTENKVTPEDIAWHRGAQCLKWLTYEEIEEEGVKSFDLVIATWWRSVYEAYRVPAKRYVYFVQSIESRFYPPEEKPIIQLADATYMLPMDIITEATWIKKHLKENFHQEAHLVRNGIRKDIYKPDGECYAKREENKLRVLVEGPVDVDFKNVPKTIQLCRQSKADEIWLMTSSDIKEYEGVDRVFSKVPMFETPKVYRSCDVIVKLSYVEGMFGPPLEMFHCGGTSITYDVTGHDEYIIHGENGLVVKRDNDEKVVQYINKLKEDKKYLENLKRGALKTAQNWVSWEAASKQFYEAIRDICGNPIRMDRSELELHSKFHFKSYVIAEDYNLELKKLKQSSIDRNWQRLKNILPQEKKEKIAKILGIHGTLEFPFKKRNK